MVEDYYELHILGEYRFLTGKIYVTTEILGVAPFVLLSHQYKN